jgi:flagellar biosynthesis protein FliR
MLGLISWRAMPLVVRVLFAVLFSFVVIVAIMDGTPWLDVLDPVYEVIYNSVLVGSAVLCLARGVLGRTERLA